MTTKKLILAIFLFASCGSTENPNGNQQSKKNTTTVLQEGNKTDNALSFINAYVENSNKLNKAVGMIDWVDANTLSTKAFKTKLKRIVDEAYKDDPELGLGFDPIVDAQDNPGAFEIEHFDEKTNYLQLKGKDWPEFKLTLRIAEENGIWLVDGCGIVNIPAAKRAKH